MSDIGVLCVENFAGRVVMRRWKSRINFVAV